MIRWEGGLPKTHLIFLILVPWALFELYEDFAWESKTCAPLSQASVRNHSQRSDLNIDTDELLQRIKALVRPRPRNLQLVFVGDSLMRYQYLSLVHWLRFGRWPDTGTHADSLIHAHSYHHEWHPHDDWNEFFLHSNRLLQPNEICDCWREVIESNTTNQQSTSIEIERRYFFEPIMNNRIVYINLYGNETDSSGMFRGYLAPTSIFTDFSPGLVGGSNRTWHRLEQNIAWRYTDWHELLRGHVAKLGLLNATMILNAGLHSHELNTLTKAEKLETVLVEGISESLWSRVMWKTTTLKRDEPHRGGVIPTENDLSWCERIECFNVSWTKKLRTEFYLDLYHFVEPVYRIQNEQLLAQLQKLPQGYELFDKTGLFI